MKFVQETLKLYYMKVTFLHSPKKLRWVVTLFAASIICYGFMSTNEKHPKASDLDIHIAS